MDLRPAVARQLDMIAFHNYGNVDEQLTQVPRHQFGFWGKYRFGRRRCARDARGDADRRHVGYEVAKWRFALNVNNLTDRVYNSVCLARGDCWWGTRRNAIASVSYRF